MPRKSYCNGTIPKQMQLLCGEINIFFADIPQSLRRENGKKKIKVLKNGCKFAHLW